METSILKINSDKDQIINSILNIANITNANFNRDTVMCIFELVEQGVDPESIIEGQLLLDTSCIITLKSTVAFF